MLGRISGLVLNVTRRSGTSGAGNAYDFQMIDVLVAGRGVASVQVTTDNDLGPGGQPVRVAPGEVVDFLVEFGTYRSDVSARLVAAEFPEVADSLSVLAGAL